MIMKKIWCSFRDTVSHKNFLRSMVFQDQPLSKKCGNFQSDFVKFGLIRAEL